jgi:hypothetical protein
MIRKLFTVGVAGFVLAVEVATYRRLADDHMLEYLIANGLLCFVAFMFAWEILEYRDPQQREERKKYNE